LRMHITRAVLPTTLNLPIGPKRCGMNTSKPLRINKSGKRNVCARCQAAL
jgi:hypothetical protein